MSRKIRSGKSDRIPEMKVPPEVAFAGETAAPLQESAAVQVQQSDATPALAPTPAAPEVSPRQSAEVAAPEATPAPEAAPAPEATPAATPESETPVAATQEPTTAQRQPLRYLHFTDGTKPFRRGEEQVLTVVCGGKLYTYNSLQISANKLEGFELTQIPYRGGQVPGFNVNHKQLAKLCAMVDAHHAEQQGGEHKDAEAARAPKYNPRNRHASSTTAPAQAPAPTAPKPPMPTPADLVRTTIAEIDQTKEAVEGLVSHYNEFSIVISDGEKKDAIDNLDALKGELDAQVAMSVEAGFKGMETPQIDVTTILAGTRAALFEINYLITTRVVEGMLRTISGSNASDAAKNAAKTVIPEILAQAKTDFESGKKDVDWKELRHRLTDGKNKLMAFAPPKEHRHFDNSRGSRDNSRGDQRQRIWR